MFSVCVTFKSALFGLTCFIFKNRHTFGPEMCINIANFAHFYWSFMYAKHCAYFWFVCQCCRCITAFFGATWFYRQRWASDSCGLCMKLNEDRSKFQWQVLSHSAHLEMRSHAQGATCVIFLFPLHLTRMVPWGWDLFFQESRTKWQIIWI